MNSKKSKSGKLLLQAIGAIPWGVFFAVAVTEILILGFIIWGPLLFWREKKRTQKYGFNPGGPIRLAVVIAVIAIAVMIPNKFEDQIIELPQAQTMSLEEIRTTASSQDVRLPFFTYGLENREDMRIRITRSPITVGELLNEIESQTGKKCSIGVCGNGMSFFKGGWVMDIYVKDPKP